MLLDAFVRLVQLLVKYPALTDQQIPPPPAAAAVLTASVAGSQTTFWEKGTVPHLEAVNFDKTLSQL